MKGQFFMNTGIQPSILFFENTGKPTSVVEFWDVIKGANGDIEETMVLSVPRAKFDASCSFDMRRYQEVKAVANPAGFTMVKLSDVCRVSFGDRITVKDNAGTIYPVYGSGGDTFKTDKFNRTGKTCKVGRFAISEVNMVMLVDGPYWLMDSGFTVESKKPETMMTEYLWYCLLMDKKRLSTISTGSCQKNIEMEGFNKIEYLCPPIETQKEIVATLDRIYAPGTSELAETIKLTDKAMDLVLAGATAQGGASLEPIVEAQRLMRKSAQMVADVKAQMVTDVKAQMVAIMKSVGHRGFPSVKLSDICNDVSTSKNIPSSERKDGEFRFFTCSRDYSTHNESHYNGTYLIHGSRGSTISESVFATDNEKFAIGTSMFLSEVKDKGKVELQYLYYYFKCNREIVDTRVNSSAIPMISKTVYYTIEVVLPPIEFQRQLLERLNALQNQLSSLENLGKQAEDNARFILDSYLNTA
jgi:restriction endonuclease S subunit